MEDLERFMKMDCRRQIKLFRIEKLTKNYLNYIFQIMHQILTYKNLTGVYTSDLAKKADLASLNFEEDKLNVDKLKIVPIDLSKLNDVGKYVVEKTVCDKWFKNLILLMLLILANEGIKHKNWSNILSWQTHYY